MHTSMFERIVPRVGDWFCFPQSVVRIDSRAPDKKEHRWIVVSSGIIDLNPQVVLRSTQDWGESGGIPHALHDGACGVRMCRIDRPGWIRTRETRKVSDREFISARKSCREPDLDLVDELMKGAQQSSRRAAPRKRRMRR